VILGNERLKKIEQELAALKRLLEKSDDTKAQDNKQKRSGTARWREVLADAKAMIANNEHLKAIAVLSELLLDLIEQPQTVETTTISIECLLLLAIAYRELDPSDPGCTENSIENLINAEKFVLYLQGKNAQPATILEHSTSIWLQAGVTYAKAFKARDSITDLLKACQAFAHVLAVDQTQSPVLATRHAEAKQYCKEFAIRPEWCQKQETVTLAELNNPSSKRTQPQTQQAPIKRARSRLGGA